jgi:hypothetical protein
MANRIEIRFKFFSTPIDQYGPGCKTLSQHIPWSTMQYMTRVNAILNCGLMRANAVRTGSMRLEPGQYGYQFGIEIHVKNFNMTKTFSLCRIVLSESIRNRHNLRCGSVGVEPGRYGFNSVWNRFEIRLYVTAFPECRPHIVNSIPGLFRPIFTHIKSGSWPGCVWL